MPCLVCRRIYVGRNSATVPAAVIPMSTWIDIAFSTIKPLWQLNCYGKVLKIGKVRKPAGMTICCFREKSEKSTGIVPLILTIPLL